jgi:hypothetical protein
MTNLHHMRQMSDAIHTILSTAGTSGSNPTVEYLATELATIDFHLIAWCDLSTTERTILRFVWEFVHRYACPLTLTPPA